MDRAAMLQGVALGFLTYGVFACGDAGVKALGGTLPVFQIVFFTTLFASAVLFFHRPRGEHWRNLFRMKRPTLVLLRAASGVIAGILGVVAFTSLPLAEAYALIFLMPMFVTVLSVPFLKEAIGWRRWSAVLLGLAGVALVVRPGFRELLPGHFAAMGVAFFAAVTVITLRAIGHSEQRVTLMGTAMLAALAVNGVLMLPEFVMPAPNQLALLAFAGTCGGIGHMGMMAALRRAPANRVAPTQYSQIVWAVLIGALIFHERPDTLAVAGIVIVVASGLFTFIREEQTAGWSRRAFFMRNRP